jgi:predicted lipid-binding transport protein (Tim44 family)
VAQPRVLRSTFIGTLAACLLVGTLAVWQFGWTESKASVLGTLDAWHIVGERTSLLHRARRLERASPSHDAERAVREGDKRLLGFSLNLEGPLVIPGIPETAIAASQKQLGLRTLFLGCVDLPEFERYRKASER